MTGPVEHRSIMVNKMAGGRETLQVAGFAMDAMRGLIRKETNRSLVAAITITPMGLRIRKGKIGDRMVIKGIVPAKKRLKQRSSPSVLSAKNLFES